MFTWPRWDLPFTPWAEQWLELLRDHRTDVLVTDDGKLRVTHRVPKLRKVLGTRIGFPDQGDE